MAALRATDQTNEAPTRLTTTNDKSESMKHIIPAIAVATGLTLSAWTTLWADEEREEKVNPSDVPAAVQQAAQAEAKGGTIVRWEKEGRNYEAVIDNNGRQTGVELTPDGKVVSRHNESKEHKEKGE
jgi:hypothetical protein